LQFKNSTLDENSIGKATKMSKTDIYRMRSAYRCDAQGEGARQPSKSGLKKTKKTKKTKGQKNAMKTGELSLVAERTLF
jgi:hypothetical protein